MTGTLATHPLPSPAPAADPPPTAGWPDVLVTVAVVVVPFLALVWGAVRLWDHGISWLNVGLTVSLYLVTGFGITLGYHRLFTHRSFRAVRSLRIGLAIAGSMAVEGSVISWVAHHRRHHVFADRPGDPHSPYLAAGGTDRTVRGLVHAHAGWLFSGVPSDPRRWCRDLLSDRDLAVVSALTPLWIALSLLVPFGIGWAVTGSWTAGLVTLMWAGLVRIALLHHMTWGVNSLGHMFGRRPYDTADRSGDVPALAVLSLGDSWHNSHHAHPALARHGRGPGEIDLSAGVLRLLERWGWVSHVRWHPGPARTDDRRGPAVLQATGGSRHA